MEVTKSNFHENLDSIIESIKSCDFMSIDGEFTGLDVNNGGHCAPFDTPEERYYKIRCGCTDFLLVQYGLCTFHANKEKQRYEARPYNFYVFPRPHSRYAPDRRFLCQSSSIDFLTSNGFDFNKLFKEGIPYLTSQAEEKLRADLSRRHEEAQKEVLCPGLTSPAAKMNVPEEQKPFLNQVFDMIGNYLVSEKEEPLALPPCNAFQRRLLYQSIEEKFPNLFLETLTGEKKERYLSISRLKDTDERQKKELEKQAREKLELDMQVGFSKVIQAMSESRKLVVGHNCYLDLVHSINQFHSELPMDLDGFKALVKTVFPRVLDTKLMASTNPFKEYFLSTGLDEVRLTVNQKPFPKVNVDLAEGFEDSISGNLHEAGYDAYITGSCFASMVRFLGTFQSPVDDFLLPTSSSLEPFVNKLFLMRINDTPYMNLSGPDVPANRDHVFHVTFPREWKPTDLYTLFHSYGTIQISWLSDTSAYVGLHRKENSKKALKALSKQTRDFQVVSYDSYQRSNSYKWSASSKTPQSAAKRKTSEKSDTPSKVPRHNSIISPGNFKQQSKLDETVELKVNKDATKCDESPLVPCEMDKSTKLENDNESNTADEKSSDAKLFEETESW